MDYDLIVVKTLERVYKNYYYIIRGKIMIYRMRFGPSKTPLEITEDLNVNIISYDGKEK